MSCAPLSRWFTVNLTPNRTPACAADGSAQISSKKIIKNLSPSLLFSSFSPSRPDKVLSLSPGGGMTADAAAWVAGRPDGYAPPGTHGVGVKVQLAATSLLVGRWPLHAHHTCACVWMGSVAL